MRRRRTGAGLRTELIGRQIRRAGRRRDRARLQVLQLLEHFRRNRPARGDRDAVRRLDDARATGAGSGSGLLRRARTQRELDELRFDAAHERELHLVARLARAHQGAELVRVEEHLIVEAREDVAFLDLAHGRALGIDEADLDADAGRDGHGGGFQARADVESGVGDLIRGGGLRGRGGGILFLRLHRTDESGEEQHVERDLTEGVHGGSFGR